MNWLSRLFSDVNVTPDDSAMFSGMGFGLSQRKDN